jgi:hypothetical protein
LRRSSRGFETEVDLGCLWDLHADHGCQCLSCRLSDEVFAERLVALCGIEAVALKQLSLCQRWDHGRDRYRPSGEVIRTADFGVEPVTESEAKAFVCTHHYSGSYPAARFRAGLFRRRSSLGGIGRDLVGVAVFSQPMNQATLRKWSGQDSGVELGRFVLLDDVAGNGESWFLARAFRLLREAKPELAAVVSYSDPVARRTASGEVVMPGHYGCIYQAYNGRYVGRSKSRTLLFDPRGQIVGERGLSKLRNGERGEAHVYAHLVAMGAPRRARGEDAHAYVKRALNEGPFRKQRHPGNHCYVWPLRRGVPLPTALPYPKPQAA